MKGMGNMGNMMKQMQQTFVILAMGSQALPSAPTVNTDTNGVINL